MTDQPFNAQLELDDLAATDILGASIARLLAPSFVLCLSGPLGSGKSELARAILRHGCGETGDIPSPTFTLVQTYEATSPHQMAGLEVWHMDLYRLEHPEEVLELGIEDAFIDAACLIEWPDRLGPYLPSGALHLSIDFGAQTEQRLIRISGPQTLVRQLV